MDITQFETNAESALILNLSTALERALRRWQKDNHMQFNQEMKQLIGNMTKASVTFKFYAEQFNDKMITSLYDKSKDIRHIEEMRDGADETIRFYLTMLNCKSNGFSAQDMEDAMNRTLDAEPEAKRLISQEFIDSFRVQK